MPKELGDTIYGNSTALTYQNGGTDVDAGAPVTAEAGGTVSEADANNGDELTGIAGSDTLKEANERVVIDGVVIAKVASGVGAGVDVDVGDSANGNAGILVASSGGPGHTLCEEGGEFEGYSLNAGEAAVKVE